MVCHYEEQGCVNGKAVLGCLLHGVWACNLVHPSQRLDTENPLMKHGSDGPVTDCLVMVVSRRGSHMLAKGTQVLYPKIRTPSSTALEFKRPYSTMM